jgi:hypothetical protein
LTIDFVFLEVLPQGQVQQGQLTLYFRSPKLCRAAIQDCHRAPFFSAPQHQPTSLTTNTFTMSTAATKRKTDATPGRREKFERRPVLQRPAGLPMCR